MDQLIADLVERELSKMEPSRSDHLRSEARRLANESDGDASEELANIVVGNVNVLSADQVEDTNILQAIPIWSDAVTLYINMYDINLHRAQLLVKW